jgi:hypothetical protein
VLPRRAVLGAKFRFEPKPTIIARPVLDKLLAGPIEAAASRGQWWCRRWGSGTFAHDCA